LIDLIEPVALMLIGSFDLNSGTSCAKAFVKRKSSTARIK